MSGDVPEGWAAITLGDVLRLEYGRALSASVRDHGDIPVYGSNGICGYHSTPLLTERGIVVGRKGTAGSVNVTRGPFWPIDTTYYVVPQIDVDFDWLAYTLEHAQLSELNEATGVPSLSRDNAYNQPVLLPSLNEQRRIAEVLRSVDESIAANRAVLLQIKAARAATLHVSFEHSQWEPVKLGDLGRWASGGTPSKADATLWGGGVPWVCPRDMKSPVITRSEDSVSQAAIGKGCKIATKGTLLIVVRGMILARAIPTATLAMDATYNQDIKAFHPNGRAIPKFIQLCLQHKEHELLKLVNTATHGTKKLDAQTISEIEIPLPDISTQMELSEAMTDMDLAMLKAGKEHIRLATIKSSLQNELLSGKVRVPA